MPGIIKELIMADILGHKIIPSKNMPDAMDEDGEYYEYLASINRRAVKTNKGSSFQLDRVTETGLHRINRNTAFYFGFFKNHLEIEEIYRVDTADVLREAQRQLESSKNEITHVNFLAKWVKAVGGIVYSSEMPKRSI